MARTGGERSRHVSAIAKLVTSIGGETPQLPGQSAPPLSQRTHVAAASATPSFNERSECPEEGWPAGPGRSLFTASSASQPVRRTVGER